MKAYKNPNFSPHRSNNTDFSKFRDGKNEKNFNGLQVFVIL